MFVGSVVFGENTYVLFEFNQLIINPTRRAKIRVANRFYRNVAFCFNISKRFQCMFSKMYEMECEIEETAVQMCAKRIEDIAEDFQSEDYEGVQIKVKPSTANSGVFLGHVEIHPENIKKEVIQQTLADCSDSYSLGIKNETIVSSGSDIQSEYHEGVRIKVESSIGKSEVFIEKHLEMHPDNIKKEDIQQTFADCSDSYSLGIKNETIIDRLKEEQFIIKEEFFIKEEDTDSSKNEESLDHLNVQQSPSQINVLENRIGSSRSQIEMFKCDGCSYQNKRKDRLREHVLVHKDESQFQMFKCCTYSYQTRGKSSHRAHKLIHTDQTQMNETFKCNRCNYGTKIKTNLKKHELVHRDQSEIDMFKCCNCNYETKRKHDLRRHLLIHMDQSRLPMFMCYACDYQTKRRRVLRKHELIHMDQIKDSLSDHELIKDCYAWLYK